MISNETKFRPVIGTKENILAAPITEGYFYVANDVGAIYVDSDGKRISAGGGGAGVSLYYAEQSEVTQDGNDYYIILASSITEEGITLKADDLILNSDGAFYKVLDINEDNNYMCEQLAISGSGGGGGGGGGTTTADTRFTYDSNVMGNAKTFVYGKDYYAEFYPESDVDNEVELAFVITQNGTQYESFSVSVESGGTYKFNTGRLPKGSGISIQVQATSVNSTMAAGPKRTFANITTKELGISKDSSFNACAIQEGECNLGFVPISNGLSQTLHVSIDGSDLDLSADSSNKTFLSFKPNGNAYTVIIPSQSHGVHTVTLSLSINISGTDLYSDEITYEIAWKEDGETAPIIWLGNYDTLVTNYSECVIPFMVYNPETELYSQKTKAYLVANGTEIATSPIEVQYDANNWIKWDVTSLYEANDTAAGKANLFTITCGSATKRVTIYVTTEGSRDLGLVNENALILNLVSTGRSNSETTNSRTSWTYNTFTTDFTDFNWYNNGWLNDDDGNGSYLSVANGASAKINLRTLALNSTYDYSFEIRFRVRNIQEYSTLIRTIPYYYINEDNKSHTVEDIKTNGYTYKVDDDGNTIMDTSSPKEISSTAGVIFKYLNNNGEGFCIGTQEAYFKTPSSVANVRYKEDEIINLAFVVSNTNKLMSIYLNGILSGALALDSTSFTMDNDSYLINSDYCDVDIYKLRIYQAELSMPDVIHNYISDIHDIDLYDQNQLTDTTDGTILLYNKLVEFNDNVAEYNSTVTDTANLKDYSMPYAVWEIIDNGTGINDPNMGTHSSDDDKLPYFKGNNRYCKVTFVNPALDAALDRGDITEDFYYTHSPSFVAIGVDINVQGTSSQAYPRRNMKTKMGSAVKKTDADGNTHDDWGWYYTKGSKAGETFKKWNMDNSNCSTAKFTWKIDYMESSGTYNTGFANLVGNGMYDYHPLSKVPGLGLTGSGYRTSVYGFPVMVFHKHSTAADRAATEDTEYLTYEYIGRYNLNLDKSSNEFYGFEVDGTHPYPTDGWYSDALADVAECWELRDNQGTWTSWKYPDAASREDGFGSQTTNGTLEVIKHFEYRYNSEGDALDIAYEDAVDSSLTEVKGSDRTVDLSTQAKKNSYLREKYSHLESLFNWLDSTDTSSVPATDTGTALDSPVTYETTVYYMVQTFREGSSDVAYYVDAEGNQLVKVASVSSTSVDENNYYVYEVDGENIMTQAIAADDYTGTKRAKDDILVTYNTDCAPYRLKKFVNEFSQHLDLEYCLVYFILSELLLCYDSRGKNMMIASWGPQSSGGDYIWYPIWYDIDTQLGLNNIGAVLWDYDTDASAEGTFSTANSVLWQNFFAGFRTAIEAKYRTLRSGSRLTEKTIEGAYLCDPDVFATSYAMKGVRPVIALGLDEWYKYIACGINKSSTWYKGTDRRYGFYVQSYDNGNSKTTDASYVYTCQGDRKLSRELFIRNRLNYLDSWWLAGSYDSSASAYKTEIMIRANANDTSTSDTYLDSTKVASDVSGYTRATYPVEFYDAVPEFEITPFLSQYVTVFYDEDPLTPTIKYDGINAVTTHTTPSVENGYRAIYPYNEQLTYIPGGDFLSDLGDLSLKYPSHFKLNTGKRLTQLLIGGDAPNYFNGIIGKESGTFDLNDSASGTNKKGLLQKIVLTGLTALNEAQDVSGSEKLREFRALKTQIPYATFAEGAPLDTVHLPRTTTRIELTYALNMTNMLTSTPEVMVASNGTYVYNDRDNYEGLYIEGLTDWVKGTSTWDSTTGNLTSTIILDNVALGYNSYKLLDNAIDIRKNYRSTGYLAFSITNVEWSPYIVVEADTDYDETATFYKLTEHNNFVVYNHTSAIEWSKLKTNKKIFTYDSTLPASAITSTEILDEIIADYLAATSVNNNHYRSSKASESVTLPSLTGTMFVNNTEETAISEIDLQDKYAKYFPDLNIYAKYVNEAYIANFVQVYDNDREEQIDVIRYDKSTATHPTMTSKIPSKTNYDFQGWTMDSNYVIVDNGEVETLKNNGIILSESDIEALEFSEENNEYTFYAVFSITSYTIHFRDAQSNIDYTSYKAAFGTTLYEPEDYFVTDESNLSDTERYKLVGWTKDSSAWLAKTEAQAKTVDLTSIVSQNSDQVFYGVYIKEDCLTNPTDDSYFIWNFMKSSYTDDYDSSYNVAGGFAVSAKVNLKGKITIPATHVYEEDGKEYPVVVITQYGFMGPSSRPATDEEKALYGWDDAQTVNIAGPGYNITHIYWYGDTSNFRKIENQAFYQTGQYDTLPYDSTNPNANRKTDVHIFKYFEMPKNVRVIDTNAFAFTYALAPFDFSETKLAYVGEGAFFSAFSCGASSYPLVHLPGTLVIIQGNAFAKLFYQDIFNTNTMTSGIITLQIGSDDAPSNLTSCGTDAFSMENYSGRINNYIVYIASGSDDSLFTSIIPNTSCLSGVSGDNMRSVDMSIIEV